jgi:hypothetical protein
MILLLFRHDLCRALTLFAVSMEFCKRLSSQKNEKCKRLVTLSSICLTLSVGDPTKASLQQRLVKTRGPLVKSSRYYWISLKGSHLWWCMFGSMLAG